MRQLIVLLVVLIGGFLGSWTYKIKTPVNRPNEYAEGYSADSGAWWNDTQEVDDSWQLDPEIPLNYIPVPGESELYMVIGTDGQIIEYRKRTKQIDGSWVWETVNPDIPSNYEPVEGLENVYKVTYEDGTVKYFKYVRNADDTFAFVEVDENGNEINVNKDATKIDGKHVHITGNIYQRLDDNGVVIGYDKRLKKDDGTFEWMPTDLPDVNSDLTNFAKDWTGGNNNPNMQVPSLDTSGVDSMAQAMAQANAEAARGSQDITNVNINISNPGGGSGNYGNVYVPEIEEPTVINNPDGTHTEVEVVRETKTIDGITSTYETYVKKTYDSAGNLVQTMKEGPYQVDTTQIPSQDEEPVQSSTGTKAATLTEEVARVTGSYTYDTNVANGVFTLLNAQRAQSGLPALTMSDTAMQIAQLRAADMAGFDVSSGSLPTYESLGRMLSDYGVKTNYPGENLWKTIERTADEIHTRFQAVDSARASRMSDKVTQYGCAIAVRNGYYYICEVFL